MKNSIKVNFNTNQIIMDRTFASRAADVRSEEYAILQNVRRDYPEFQVIRRQIKKNPSKESYRGLTYQYMEDYIASHTDSEKRTAEYKELRLLAECHSVRYPTIKKWFLETYPEVSKYGLSNEENDSSNSDYDDSSAKTSLVSLSA